MEFIKKIIFQREHYTIGQNSMLPQDSWSPAGKSELLEASMTKPPRPILALSMGKKPGRLELWGRVTNACT